MLSISQDPSSSWYSHLQQYFKHEMKSRSQIESLLKLSSSHQQHDDQKRMQYCKWEDETSVVLFAEFPQFIFLDYIWVHSDARGKGTGSRLIRRLKEARKPIVLEMDVPDGFNNSTDQSKRYRFYSREGFRIAYDITYRYKSRVTGEMSPLYIVYWIPEGEDFSSLDQSDMLNFMRTAYTEVHSHRISEFYPSYKKIPVQEALTMGDKTARRRQLPPVTASDS